MVIAEIILILNVILWLLPPIRQYTGRYFLYFFILAISDPVNILLIKFLNVDPFKTHFVISLILLLIVINLGKRVPYYQLIISILVVIILFYQNNKIFEVLIFVIHICIFFYFCLIIIQYYYAKEKLILFHFALLFYEMTVALKFIFLLINFKSGLVDFYITNFIQILLAIYFCWDIEEKPKIVLLKKTNINHIN